MGNGGIGLWCPTLFLTCILILLVRFTDARAQGTFLRTGGGEALQSLTVPLTVPSGSLEPILQFDFGFATDERRVAGEFLDSFTITLQGSDPASSALLVTIDAFGPVWAPPNPGGLPIDPGQILRSAIPFPDRPETFQSSVAFRVTFPIPPALGAQSATVHLDLFDNQNAAPSLAWGNDIVIVPEPDAATLCFLGGVLVLFIARIRTGGRLTVRRSCIRATGAGPMAACFVNAAPERVRRLAGIACGLFLFAAMAAAQTSRDFVLQGTRLTLQEVTPQTEVYFQSMRLNRALNVWNVEMSVSNRSDRVLSGPIVVLVDSATGTSEVRQADGVSEGKRFFEMGNFLPQGGLRPREISEKRTLTLEMGAGAPRLTTRVFAPPPPGGDVAVAFLRTLDEVGQPLPGVAVEESGPGGSRSTVTDPLFAVATVGRTAGEHFWRFTAPDHLPVWRKQILDSRGPGQVISPRLTRRGANAVVLTPTGGGSVSNATTRIVFGPASVSSNQTATLTPLTAQTLPALLPLGWSPMQAFWLEVAGPVANPPAVTLVPWGPFQSGETGALARWNSETLQWDTVRIVTGSGTNAIATTVPGPGAYVLVAGDGAPNAPPAPLLNAPLAPAPISLPDASVLKAGGRVVPSASPASLIPELVTGTATVIVTNEAGALPSGMVLRAEVREEYRMSDGTRRKTPRYEHFIAAYQRPGDSASNTLHAVFPIRPLILFEASELEEAIVHVDVLPPAEFGGSILATTGGVVSGEAFRVIAGAGDLDSPQAAQVRELPPEDFADVAGGSPPLGAFDLSVSGVMPGEQLTLQMAGSPTNGLFVIARVLQDRRIYGIEPVERLASDGQGRLFTLETNSVERLPGITGPGQYVLVQVNQPQALVRGIARDATGQPSGGMLVRLGQWTTLSREPDGSFSVLAPAGTHELATTDLESGDAGAVTIAIQPGQTVANPLLTAELTGPRVVTISPARDAAGVSRVAPVVIHFSRALNPATLLGGGVQLLRTNNQTVDATLTLNLANNRATLLPNATLDPATPYRVVLSTNIADMTGRRIEGETAFAFETVALSARDAAAQLIIYEPGATNVPAAVLSQIPAYRPGANPSAIVVRGTPGAADPERAVVLVNESSGETTTVLSKPDGSFASVIEGAEEDFVSATFINLNGSRVYVPVSRQEFDNGFVGLYRQGGLLEAQSDGGPVRVLIEPEAIETRSKLRLTTITKAQLLAEMGGVTPEVGQAAADPVVLEAEGPVPEGGIHISVPVDLRTLEFPAGVPPEKAAMVLTVAREVQGVRAFEVAAPMTFKPERAAAAAAVRRSTGDEFLYYGTAESAMGFLPGGDLALIAFRFVLVPMLLGHEPMVVKGQTVVLDEDLNRDPTADLVGDIAAGIAFQTSAEQVQAAMAGRPLSGAYVVLHDPLIPFGPPGRLRPGVIYATSDRQGNYLMTVPVGGYGYIITATHPRYQDRPAEPVVPLFEISLAGAVFKFLVFKEPLAHQVPPRISIAHSPLLPAPGEECQVHITASQGASAPPRIQVNLGEVKPLAGGVDATQEDVTLEILSDERIPGNRQRVIASVKTDKAVQVTLSIYAASRAGEGGVSFPPFDYPIIFSGAPQPDVTENIPPSDPTEVLGPVVVATFPADGGYVGDSGEVRVVFNEPLDNLMETEHSGILLNGPGFDIVPVVQLSDDQREVRLRFAGLEPDSEYILTLSGASFRDLKGNRLDQKPSTAAREGFTMRFRAAPVGTFELPGVVDGVGVTINGTRLYALDRSDNSLVAFDISNPTELDFLTRIRLRGVPRDLVAIPNYSYARRLHNENVYTNRELVAVVSGDLGSRIDDLGNIIVPGQQLLVYDITDAAKPVRLANPLVSLRDATVVRKIRWEPPLLSYLEFGADIQSIGYIDLQELIIGFNATPGEVQSFPSGGKRGKDANGDGDYVDPGDTLPLPDGQPPEFFGKQISYVLDDTTQKIQDYASIDGSTVGVALKNGFRIDPNGQISGLALRPAYRTLAFNGFDVDANAGAYYFSNGAFPKRVTIVGGLPILVTNKLTTPIVALVSLAPDADGVQKLVAIDITLPESPMLINTIPFPDEVVGGSLQSVVFRQDTLRIEVATSRNVLVLDPLQLAEPNPERGLHPAVVGFLSKAGSATFSYGTSDFGVHAASEGGRNEVILTEPRFSFVNFPDAPEVVNPLGLPAGEMELQSLYEQRATASSIFPARLRANRDLGIESDLDPPVAASHYHVLLEAPGGAGPKIEIGVETLSMAGKPKPNLGLGFPPVRAVTSRTLSEIGQEPRPECDAPIQPLTAYRMSNDAASPFYNRFLSRPFVMIYEQLRPGELETLKSSIDREVLWNGAYVRAFIDPAEENKAVVGRFAARVDEELKRIQPLASVTVPALDLAYVMGNNPPPAGGHSTLPGTFESVSGHNGEVRMDATDLALPSPRMGIEIVRTIGGQDLYEGPFGRGWDFNYNERIVELSPHVFPAGLQMPLIARKTIEESVIGSSQDVLLHSGYGRTIHFRHAGTNTPPEYAQDLLVEAYGWPELVAHYFLPEDGVFDLLVRFKDGKYERLTPDGTRHRYSHVGRLEEIIDRFPQNRIQLEYDRNGHLVRVDDRSVIGDRYIEIGYYRFKSDPDFATGLDEVTKSAYLEGKICRIKDYADRDVLYFYNDEGLLVRRESVEVNGENGGFRGRNQTHYTYENCRLIGVAVGRNATPLFNAKTVEKTDGAPVVDATTGVGGPVQVDVPPGSSSSATIEGQTSSATQADGRVTEIQFDKNGYASSVKISGAQGEDSVIAPIHNEHGHLLSVTYPEGRVESRVYDTNNVVFRSRGNLLSITVAPGPRGGEGYTQTFSYDPRYNLPSGAQTDPNGFSHIYTLTSDGREVQSVRHGDAGEETFTYNTRGQLTAHRDYNGIETGYTYDSTTGFIQTRRLGENTYTFSYGGGIAGLLGEPSAIQPPRGAPTQFKYNSQLREVEMSRGGLITRNAYDEQGRMSFISEELGDGKRRETRLTINALGFMTERVVSGIEVNGTETALTTVYTPDEQWRVKSILHPGNAVQTLDYDKRNDVIEMTLGEYAEEYIRDRHGNVVELKQGGETVATTIYDGFDRPKSISRLTGAGEYVTERSYYPGNELKEETVTDPDFGVVRRETFFEIDAVGRVRRRMLDGTTVDPEFRYTYSENARTINGPRQTIEHRWDSDGYLTRYDDDVLTAVLRPDGNGNVERVERQEDGASYAEVFTYDDLDNRDSASDNFGALFTFVPRADGSNLEIINARSHSTKMEHSALGELLMRRRADGMEFRFRHNEQRQIQHSGDSLEGFDYDYDEVFRLKERTLRNGASVTFDDFDPRNFPRKVTMPGGTMAIKYDRQGRTTNVEASYQNTSYETSSQHDALDRVRVVTYKQEGGTENTITYSYDRSGPLLSARFQEDGGDFTVRYEYNGDLSRKSINYPSGITVNEERDSSGRLIGISGEGGNILRVTEWQGNSQPKSVQIGATMQARNQWDSRGRMTGNRVTRSSDGAVLVHMRYQYDAVDNVEIRQFVHRGGKAEVFVYDTGERVSKASAGVLPLIGGAFSNPEYERTYGYHAIGLDYLISSSISGELAARAPPFANSWASHDSFLLPFLVNGFDRGDADPMGNVKRAELQTRAVGVDLVHAIPANLTHNGLGRLVRIARDDGVVIENRFEPGGLRHGRRVTGAGNVSQRTYIYDDSGRLLEEYENVTGAHTLVARYFYHSSDAPIAADLQQLGDGLQRFYFLNDIAHSVIAVADAGGRVVERVRYDTFGQPAIEARDDLAPAIKRIVGGPGGSLLVELSEPVVPTTPDPMFGGGIVPMNPQPPEIANSLSVRIGMPPESVTGTSELVSSLAGYTPNSVIRFTPTRPLTGGLSVSIGAGLISDEWRNTNAAQTVTFTNESPTLIDGAVVFSRDTNTAPAVVTRSSVGSPFLFHGQYFDYDTGLIYLRARFYDPFSGMFLEPDPFGYEDSVNLYAGMKNNPVSLRDPSGAGVGDWLRRIFGRFRRAPKPPKLSPRTTQMAQQQRELAERLSRTQPKLQVPVDEVANAGPVKIFESGDKVIYQHGEYLIAERPLTGTWPGQFRGMSKAGSTSAHMPGGVKPLPGMRGMPTRHETVSDTVSVYHGSINDYSKIKETGFDLHRGTVFVSRDRRASVDAISKGRYDVSEGLAKDPGIIEARIPKAEFDRYFAPTERHYGGFGRGLGSSEIRLQTPEAIEVFNRHIVRDPGRGGASSQIEEILKLMSRSSRD